VRFSTTPQVANPSRSAGFDARFRGPRVDVIRPALLMSR
jgi:hypothetical protein